MLHQRREPLRLVSKKSQAQVSEAQTRSAGSAEEVSSSAADRATGQSGMSRLDGSSAQAQAQANRLAPSPARATARPLSEPPDVTGSAGAMRACAIASPSARFNSA